VSTILKASNLHTYYGKSHILYDVSLEVGEGEIVTLLGRNGAGKTTTLRSLVGLTAPRQGTIEIFGQDTTHWAAYKISRLGVGYVPEGRKIFPNLTVMENLTVPVTRPGMWTMERVFELFPNLSERRESFGRQLSGGEQEMLAIARTLLINPKILLLDEPSQGLAPLLVREVFRVVASMRKEGISILLVEQNARFGLEVADRVYVLNNGEVVHSGSASELAKDEERVRALAGVGGKEGALSTGRKEATTA
jgi:branched-chain amino acid transport system ATP-binding protein